jgi:hypothetical protein
MPQEKRFMRGLLPDYRKVVLKRTPARLLCPVAIARELIGVEEEKPPHKGFAVPLYARETLNGHVDPCAWIASTAAKIAKFEVERQIAVTYQVAQPTRVADLALPLAADEDWSALRPQELWSPHPI